MGILRPRARKVTHMIIMTSGLTSGNIWEMMGREIIVPALERVLGLPNSSAQLC